jgi:hypothetical protein
MEEVGEERRRKQVEVTWLIDNDNATPKHARPKDPRKIFQSSIE